MIIRVSDLEDEAVTVEDAAALAGAYSDPDWRLEHVRLVFERDGADVLAHGRIAATVPLQCSRCLEPLRVPVAAEVGLRLVPRPATTHDAELARDDLDVDFYANDQIDVARLVEAETTLAVPMKPLCREACRGLCPACGTNRNLGDCACAERPADPRWAALGRLTARPSR
jgi:uncharacterized protein